MTTVIWAETNREALRELLPDALVIMPVGATEQHGPHLATGTDALLAATAARRAAEIAGSTSPRPLVLAPELPFGASDHHLPFSGTLSLRSETLLAVLVDLLRSIAECGGRRAVLVNGHGGNTGLCHAAAAAAASRHDIAVAHLNYWRMAGADVSPGHAGEFETSLVGAVRPDLIWARPTRDDPPVTVAVDGVEVHDASLWSAIDGFTDRPDTAGETRGAVLLDSIVETLADRLIELAHAL